METLSEEQAQVLQAVVSEGKSCFLTGCGGTGKSYLTNVLIAELIKLHGAAAVAVTATTGIAACHIRGTSLHSFAGIGLGDAKDLVAFINNSKKAKEIKERWRNAKCLVVDEISMLDGKLFDRLNDLAKCLRNNSEQPFGGIQLLLVGDFAQLPPVHGTFCFESKSWKEAVELQVELKKVFRQANVEFVELLRSIRNGVCTPTMTRKLMECARPLAEDGSGIKATQLYCKNMDVDMVNLKSLMELPGPMSTFLAKDTGQSPFLEALQKNCLAPVKLMLKPGAQVMLLKNLSVADGLSNGARGVYLETTPQGNLRVNFDSLEGTVQTVEVKRDTFKTELAGRTVAQRAQYPLRLAYAITVHKCQGMTLSKAELSLRDVFECGQAYVALSRVSSMAGLRLLDFSARAVRCHPKVLEFYAGCYAVLPPSPKTDVVEPTVAKKAKTALFFLDE